MTISVNASLAITRVTDGLTFSKGKLTTPYLFPIIYNDELFVASTFYSVVSSSPYLYVLRINKSLEWTVYYCDFKGGVGHWPSGGLSDVGRLCASANDGNLYVCGFARASSVPVFVAARMPILGQIQNQRYIYVDAEMLSDSMPCGTIDNCEMYCDDKNFYVTGTTGSIFPTLFFNLAKIPFNGDAVQNGYIGAAIDTNNISPFEQNCFNLFGNSLSQNYTSPGNSVACRNGLINIDFSTGASGRPKVGGTFRFDVNNFALACDGTHQHFSPMRMIPKFVASYVPPNSTVTKLIGCVENDPYYIIAGATKTFGESFLTNGNFQINIAMTGVDRFQSGAFGLFEDGTILGIGDQNQEGSHTGSVYKLTPIVNEYMVELFKTGYVLDNVGFNLVNNARPIPTVFGKFQS